MDKHIATRDLQPGMVIIRVTQQNGPVKIKKSGLVTSMDMVQGLIEMGIQQVEIDPEQTVEVEAPKVKKSTTRKMLESNSVNNNRIDDGLSEQFHRSLFLPSVQDIPSAWQFYTKRYALATFLAIGGFGLGWVLAHYQEISTSITSPSITPSSPAEMVVQTSELKKQDAELNTVNQTQDTVEASAQDITEQNPIPKSQVNTPNNIVNSEIVSSQTRSEKPVPAPEPVVEVNTPQAPETPVSAELLARFKEAVSQVADEPVDTITEQPSSDEDVPRIDQLPVWVMTELPSMSFSAHMYASNDQDRWVRVNGIRMVEGDMIDDKVQILGITSQHVILVYKGQEFSMGALTDW